MLPDFVIDLLRSQSGAVARHQIRAVEPDRQRRRSIYDDPQIELVTPRVLRHRAVPPSTDQSLMVGVLDAGPRAFVWSRSAATKWGFGRERLLPPHVAVPRRCRADVGGRFAQIHVIGTIEDRDHTTLDGIPIARPEIVILWLAGALTHRYGHEIARDRLGVIVDQSWRQRLVDGPFLHSVADRSGGKGRSGIVVLRQVLESRPPDYQPAGSRLEERFEEVVGPAVSANLERQVTVDATPIIRTVDYRLRAWPLIVEINGEAFHSSVTDRAADEERYERLLELGFSVAVFWEYDVWFDPGAIRTSLGQLTRRPDAEPTLHRPTKAPWAC